MSRRYYLAPATGSVLAAENVEGAHDESIGSTFVPCVVIDPEDSGQVARLVELLGDRGWMPTQGHGLRDALREFAKPKPAEPTGLGAVVEDADGLKWVRVSPDGDWRVVADDSFCHTTWTTIAVARVLSEGVSDE